MGTEESNVQLQNGEERKELNIDEDIVENFAAQLDEVVRIQGEESEEEDNDMFGYQPLAQNEDDEAMEYTQLQSEDEEETIQDPLNIEIDESNRLAPETTDLIKSIMSNIQLSEEAIPDWAKKIPEQAWLPRVKKD